MPSRSRNKAKSPMEAMLMGLPKGIREKAIANMNPKFVYYKSNPNNVRQAVGTAFSWKDSPEGHKFWSKVHADVDREESNA